MCQDHYCTRLPDDNMAVTGADFIKIPPGNYYLGAHLWISTYDKATYKHTQENHPEDYLLSHGRTVDVAVLYIKTDIN